MGADHAHDQEQPEGIDQHEALAAHDPLAAIEAAGPAHLSGLDRLAVQDRRAGTGRAPFPLAQQGAQRRVEPFPGAIARPLVKVVAHGGPPRELFGQQPPGTPGPHQIEKGIEHLAQRDGAGAARLGGRRHQGLEHLPLGVGQIGGIRRTGTGRAWGHGGILPADWWRGLGPPVASLLYCPAPVPPQSLPLL